MTIRDSAHKQGQGGQWANAGKPLAGMSSDQENGPPFIAIMNGGPET
jgi:hypothetical protein